MRECVAKKAAADELYHQYCEGQKAGLKVSFLNILQYPRKSLKSSPLFFVFVHGILATIQGSLPVFLKDQ